MKKTILFVLIVFWALTALTACRGSYDSPTYATSDSYDSIFRDDDSVPMNTLLNN